MRRLGIQSTLLLFAGVLISVLFPEAATAQAAGGTSAPNSQGPMIVERVKSGFLAAPDFKITEFDKTTSTLAGAYAGWLADQMFLIGGGGYWLVDGSGGREMAYGGLVLGLFSPADRRFGFGAKGLIGGGEATLAGTVVPLYGFYGRAIPPRPIVSPRSVRFQEGFFIAEPEADAMFRLTKHLRLTGGIGYRLIGASHDVDDRVRGITGSIGLQIGGGS
jgi:hypothetical protein